MATDTCSKPYGIVSHFTHFDTRTVKFSSLCHKLLMVGRPRYQKKHPDNTRGTTSTYVGARRTLDFQRPYRVRPKARQTIQVHVPSIVSRALWSFRRGPSTPGEGECVGDSTCVRDTCSYLFTFSPNKRLRLGVRT